MAHQKVTLSPFEREQRIFGYLQFKEVPIGTLFRFAPESYLEHLNCPNQWNTKMGARWCVAGRSDHNVHAEEWIEVKPIWIDKNPITEPHIFDTGNEVMQVLTPTEIMNFVIEEVGIPCLLEALIDPMPGANLASDTLSLVCSAKGWKYHGSCKRARTGYKCVDEKSAIRWDMILHPNHYPPAELEKLK